MGSDIRHALRVLFKSPGFSALIFGVLAVGIGATTTIFSVVHGVLLKPLPYGDPARLVTVVSIARGEDDDASYPDLTDWRAQARSFDGMAGFTTATVTMTGTGPASTLRVAATTADLFRIFAVTPLRGRTLAAADDAPGAMPVAVLSESAWAARFARRASIVGETLTLDNRPTTIVGVLPAGFQFPVQAESLEAWVPIAGFNLAAQLRDQRGAHFLQVVARLAPETTLEQANAEIRTIGRRLAAAYPDSNADRTVRAHPMQERLVADYRLALIALFGAVTAVLLVACGNVANLLLARGTVRQREMAIRAAIGAPRARLIRQLLVESVILSVAAGAAGVAGATWGVDAIAAAAEFLQIPRLRDLAVDRQVLAFATVLSVATGILFGLAPALQLSFTDAADALRAAAHGLRSRQGERTRQTLVVIEVALSLVLLAEGGLLVRSLTALQRVDPGFVAEHAISSPLTLSATRYQDADAQVRFYDNLQRELATIPGATAAGLATTMPMSGDGVGLGYTIEGEPQAPGQRRSATYFAVNPAYFTAMGIPLLQGRTFTVRDAADAPPVIVISDTMARRHFPRGDALGKRITIGYNNTGPREVVGIVADVKNEGLWDEPEPSMYTPFPQTPWPFLSAVVRTNGEPAALTAALRAAILRVDPEQPLDHIQTVTSYIAGTLAAPRFVATVFAGFAVFALLLAGCGLFSVVAYSVAQRRREIGIRIALGAQSSDVRALIVRQAIGLGGAGLAIGLVAALAVGQFLNELLFAGVTATDPVTFTGVSLTLLLVLTLAAWMPVRRAVTVNPVVALRAD